MALVALAVVGQKCIMKQVTTTNAGLKTFAKWEIALYFLIYISYLIYGINELIAIRFEILDISEFGFNQGWPLINSPRDESNEDLEYFTLFIQKNWYWYVVHIAISVALQNGVLSRPGLAFAVTSTVFIIVTFHGVSILCICAMLLSYYALSKNSSKTAVWILSGVWIVIITSFKSSSTIYHIMGYEEFFKLFVSLSWMLLKCCSFVFNRSSNAPEKNMNVMPTKSNEHDTKSFDRTFSLENYLGYTLYFPTLIYGPFMGFQRFIVVQYTASRSESCSSLLWLLCKGLLRWFFWWCVMHLALHFVYIHYMERNINAVRLIENPFSQYAIVYCMGQFFYMYYVITYGLSITIARFDGLNPPNQPRCVSCVNSYTKMWKFFDEGLYEFLFQHIYTELCQKNSAPMKKVFASFVTFAFTFVWHGFYMNVLTWSLINLACLIAEKILNYIATSKKYNELVTKNIGNRNSQRLIDLIATQIFIPASFSHLYFFSGSRTGNLLMRGAYCSGISNYLMLTCCCYSFTQSSEIISSYVTSKKSNLVRKI